ncbi:MAG: ABC transporter ATP-binding protein/permease [Clostridia bacterium]|nr:ABC transporter ATP-binding protein/permease [Clostridia bacterium]
MLELKNITKKYVIGENVTNALNGVDVAFGEREFVAILGTSGSGKTTMLNVIGGLDQYDSGDLIINGVSTKEYKSRDWDTYRNHSVGFVFQSYNLIPHQTVLANVELALTLSGVSKSERRKRAMEALEKVGLSDQAKKKPNQMSGGQMQRVAIARALINNPDIVLADEPTGALDTETSKQIMHLLEEISKDKLVIMVTHNPEIASEYATRIVRLRDGQIISDEENTPAYTVPESNAADNTAVNKGKKKRTSMSFFTALSLSMRNLMTKKGRTFLTSFAGSIGIIGIALILSLSNGINLFIENVQRETLASYPVTIEGETIDVQSLMLNLVDNGEGSGEVREDDRIYGSFEMSEMYESMQNIEMRKNNLEDFKKFIDDNKDRFDEHTSSIVYGYDADVYVYGFDPDGKFLQINPSTLLNDMYEAMGMQVDTATGSMSDMYMDMYNLDVWTELLPGQNGETINPLLTEQYEVVAGSWPDSYDEVVLIVNRSNELSDIYLSALGILTEEEILDATEGNNKEEISWSYDDFIGRKFYAVLPTDKYSDVDGDGIWTDMSSNEEYMKIAAQSGQVLKISGIIRPGEDSNSSFVQGAIGYTHELTRHFIEKTNEAKIVVQQKENPTVDVFTGLIFDDGTYVEPTDSEKAKEVSEYIAGLTVKEKAELYTQYACDIPEEMLEGYTAQQMAQFPDRASMEQSVISNYVESSGMDEETIRSYLAQMTDEELYAAVSESVREMIRQSYAAETEKNLASVPAEQLAGMLDMTVAQLDETALGKFYDAYLPPVLSDSTYNDNIALLEAVDPEVPSSINIYAVSFEAKETIADIIAEYNSGVDEEDQIQYTDYVQMLMSSVTTIVNAISTVLIAFVAISLVVSSIMIGIITYISVLERTKEIGILRAIGASKGDISRVFNAETFVIGLISGLLGIGITALLCIPANIIIEALTDIPNVAKLPVDGAVILVIISVVLTLIGGLIPSRIAAKKDPVVALRTE